VRKQAAVYRWLNIRVGSPELFIDPDSVFHFQTTSFRQLCFRNLSNAGNHQVRPPRESIRRSDRETGVGLAYFGHLRVAEKGRPGLSVPCGNDCGNRFRNGAAHDLGQLFQHGHAAASGHRARRQFQAMKPVPINTTQLPEFNVARSRFASATSRITWVCRPPGTIQDRAVAPVASRSRSYRTVEPSITTSSC